MKDSWQEFHRRWARLKPPLRPNAQVVEALHHALEGKLSHVLLLGVTPELANIGISTVALDKSANMIASVWPGDTQSRRSILCDWLNMPIQPQFSAVLGDGSLNVISHEEYPVLFEKLNFTLLPDARIAIRVFITPDECETVAELRERTLRGPSGGFHAFKWRLAMAIAAERGNPSTPTALIHKVFEHEFPDRTVLARATGWPEDEIGEIDAYADSSNVYSFPTRQELTKRLPKEFKQVRFLTSGSYELAERCPIFVAEFRP